MSEPKMHVWNYWRSYYDVNRSTWPEMGRTDAALDAWRLAYKIAFNRPFRRSGGPS